MVYKNGKWKMIEDVEVNAKGTLTCTTYENFCPVAILVPADTVDGAQAPDTGVGADSDAVLWTMIGAASLAALVVLFAVQRKRSAR